MRSLSLLVLVLGACGGLVGSAVADDVGAYTEGQEAFDRGDFDEALAKWLPHHPERDSRVIFRVGRILLVHGGKENIELGMTLISASADRGYIPALEFRAQSRLEGMYVAQDIEGVLSDLLEVARKPASEKRKHAYEAAEGLLTLHSFFGFGAFVKVDLERKAALLRESADMGDAGAQYFLGLALVKGSRETPRDLVEAHKYFVLSWKQDGGIFTPGNPTTPKRWMPAKDPALAIRKKLSPEQLERSRRRIRAWLDEKDAGTLGWAFDPKSTRSAGELTLHVLEEMHRDIGAGMSSMDLEFQMPCIPMASNARRECVQGHVGYRTRRKKKTATRSVEHWTYVSGSTTRVYPVSYTDKPDGGLSWRILTPLP